VDALDSPSPLLRRWLCLCIGKLVEGSEDGVNAALALSAHEKLYQLLHDRSVHVRAAAVISLAAFLQPVDPYGDDQDAVRLNTNVDVAQQLLMSRSDASPLVRCELVHALVRVVLHHRECLRLLNPAALSAFIQAEEAKYNLVAALEINRSLPGTLEQRTPGESPRLSFCPDLLLTQSDFCGEGGAASGDQETLHLHLQVVRSIVLLANDPVPSVCKVAYQLLKGVKELTRDREDEVRATPPSASAFFGSDTPGGGGGSGSLGGLRLGRSPHRKKHSVLSGDCEDGEESQSKDTEKEATPPSVPTSSASMKRAPLLKLPAGLCTESDDEDTDATKCKTSLLDGRPTSDFFQRNAYYFVTPLLRCTATQDISGRHQLGTQWKMSRNERAIVDALVDGRWKDVEHKRIDDNACGVLSESETGVRTMIFHPFNPILISSDNFDSVFVWNLDDLRAVNTFRATASESSLPSKAFACPTTPARETRPVITSMALINPHHYSLLLAATNAGCVHVFRDYVNQGRTKTVSGFRVVQSDYLWKQWRCLVDWNQTSGLLSVSSQCNVVTVWDLFLERCALDLRLPQDVTVSALMSDKASGDVLLLGCTDGTLELHDLRVPEPSVPQQLVKEHGSQIIRVHTQASHEFQIVTGASGGDVKLWDMRNLTASLHTIDAGCRKSMTALAVHDYSPIFACGTQSLRINVNNFAGDVITTITHHTSGWMHHSSWTGSRMSVRCLAFHPFRPWLAAGDTDSLISLYRLEDDRKRTAP